jgi:transposase InsO family protein
MDGAVGISILHATALGTPKVVHTDRGTAFHNKLIAELLRVAGPKQSLTTAYSKEENAIVERGNKEVLRHLNALLFDAHVHDKWSYEQLPMVQRIMNMVETTSTGVTPAELILNNAIRLQARILAPLGSAEQIALSDTVDEWISKQHTLITIARTCQ